MKEEKKISFVVAQPLIGGMSIGIGQLWHGTQSY